MLLLLRRELRMWSRWSFPFPDSSVQQKVSVIAGNESRQSINCVHIFMLKETANPHKTDTGNPGEGSHVDGPSVHGVDSLFCLFETLSHFFNVCSMQLR